MCPILSFLDVHNLDIVLKMYPDLTITSSSFLSRLELFHNTSIKEPNY